MRSLLGLIFWSLFVIPATIGGVIGVNQAFPELLGKANQQNESSPTQLPPLQSDISSDIESSSLPSETQNITYTTVNNYTTNTTTNPVTENTVEFDLDDITEHRLLYVDDDDLEVFGQGSDGQVLQATGDGLPEWVDLGTVTTDWASPGAIGGTSPNTAIFTQANLSGNSIPLIVGSTSDFQVLDEGRLEISYDGDSGYLSSSGGAIFINNTDNIGTGIGIYSNAAGDALGNMINVKVDNPLYNQAAFYMNYDGLSNAVEIVSNSDDSSSNALAVTGNNINDSTLGIIGYELAKGTIKVSHYRPGSGNDSSASALSIDLRGSGTRAQGVYVDSTESGGTLGNLLRLRNESIDRFVVNYQGNLTTAGNITQGANGSDTTFTKYGNVAGDEFFIGTNGAGRFQRSASNSEVFRAQIAGDANGRWVGTSDGRMRWGDGTNATDVTLRRIGTARLGVEGAITLNNLNADADTVIKGVTDSNLFYVDASADNIGIGTTTPLSKVDIATGQLFLPEGTNSAPSLAGRTATTQTTGIRWSNGLAYLASNGFDYLSWGYGTGQIYALRTMEFSNTDISFVNGGEIVSRIQNILITPDSGYHSVFTTGNVGIGTSTNLTAKLNVNGTIKTTSEGDIFSQLDGDSATTYPIFARYWDAHDTFPSSTFIFGNGTNSIVGIEEPGSTPVSLFRVRSDLSTFTGNVAIGTTASTIKLLVYDTADPAFAAVDATNGVSLFGQASDTYATYGTSTNHTLFITTNSLPRITILNGGNVGIGTTNPGAPLHVSGGDIWLENNQAYRIKDSGGSARSVLAYTSGNNVQLYNYATTGVVQIGINNASNTGSIRFFTNNNVEQVRIDPAGLGVGATTFGTGADNVLAIASSTAPSTSITDGIQLFAVDQGGLGHELRVRDEVGNVTTISPHNFSALPDGISEPMAWTYYSERDGKAITADMTKALRLVESLSGVELVYVKDLETGEYLENESSVQADLIKESSLEWKEELQKYLSKESMASLVSWDTGVWKFLAEVVFKARATFEKTAVFLADVQIFGKLQVGKDTAGTVKIPAGATSITVTFSSPYQAAPLVYLTPVGEAFEDFSITQISEAAFTVQLEQPVNKEIMFNWLAVIGDEGESTAEVHFSSPTPAATPIPEIAGAATESAQPETEANPASQSAEASGSASLTN